MDRPGRRWRGHRLCGAVPGDRFGPVRHPAGWFGKHDRRPGFLGNHRHLTARYHVESHPARRAWRAAAACMRGRRVRGQSEPHKRCAGYSAAAYRWRPQVAANTTAIVIKAGLRAAVRHHRVEQQFHDLLRQGLRRRERRDLRIGHAKGPLHDPRGIRRRGRVRVFAVGPIGVTYANGITVCITAGRRQRHRGADGQSGRILGLLQLMRRRWLLALLALLPARRARAVSMLLAGAGPGAEGGAHYAMGSGFQPDGAGTSYAHSSTCNANVSDMSASGDGSHTVPSAVYFGWSTSSTVAPTSTSGLTVAQGTMSNGGHNYWGRHWRADPGERGDLLFLGGRIQCRRSDRRQRGAKHPADQRRLAGRLHHHLIPWRGKWTARSFTRAHCPWIRTS